MELCPTNAKDTHFLYSYWFVWLPPVRVV
jgi:hypothetical protein